MTPHTDDWIEYMRGSEGVSTPPDGLVLANESETIPVPGQALQTPQVASIETNRAETKSEKQDTRACPPPLRKTASEHGSGATEHATPKPDGRKKRRVLKGRTVQMRLRVPGEMAASLGDIRPSIRQRILHGFWSAYTDRMDIPRFCQSQSEIRTIGVNINQALVIFRGNPTTENNFRLITEIGKLATFLEALGGGR